MSGIGEELRDLAAELEHHDPSSSPGVIARGLKTLVTLLADHFGDDSAGKGAGTTGKTK